jgi:hypothetical protein
VPAANVVQPLVEEVRDADIRLALRIVGGVREVIDARKPNCMRGQPRSQKRPSFQRYSQTRRCRKYALIVNDHDRKSFSKTAGLSRMSSQKRVRLRFVLVKTPKLE